MTLTFDYKRAAATCIFFHNSILLGKRVEEWEGEPIPYGGYWSIFGGMVEENESPFKAASREVMEETQIFIPVHELKFIKILKGDDVELAIYAYESPELVIPILNGEHSEYGWFKISELDHFPEKIDPKIIECVNFYIERRTAMEKHYQSNH